MTETIYIPLEDEDVSVRRPARAYPLGHGRYIVLRPADYDPSVETWSFPPGSVVECQMLPSEKGTVLTAVRRVAEPDAALGRQAV